MTFGHPWLHYDAVDSTMDVAREVFIRTQACGTVVQAQAQTAGRGRQGRAWFTPPSGTQVCLTLIGGPVALAGAWSIAPCTGVAIHDGLVQALPECQPRLRFPNDVLLAGRKVAGVLVETIPLPGSPGLVVPLIGIGINVNVPRDVFPSDLREKATSLHLALGRAVHEPIAEAVVAALGTLWEVPRADLLRRWRAALDPTVYRSFLLEGRRVRCRVIALETDGSLLLETDDGERHALSAAQVIFGDD